MLGALPQDARPGMTEASSVAILGHQLTTTAPVEEETWPSSYGDCGTG
jgi:hypothetical protein